MKATLPQAALACFLWGGTSGPGHAASSDPTAAVRAVVKLDSGGGSGLFNDKPNGLMRRYFTKSFVIAWTAAFQHNQDGPFMDGDPITGYQTVKSLTIKRIRTEAQSATQVSVTTTLFVQLGAPSMTLDVGFRLKSEDGGWKIDDVSNKVSPSLHEYLNQARHNQ